MGSIFGPKIPESREKHNPKKTSKTPTNKHENVCRKDAKMEAKRAKLEPAKRISKWSKNEAKCIRISVSVGVEIGFWIDFGSISGAVLAPFGFQNGSTNEQQIDATIVAGIIENVIQQ